MSKAVFVVPKIYLTSQDHPLDRLSFMVYLCGCPFSCRGCHNPELRRMKSNHCRQMEVDAFVEFFLDYAKVFHNVKDVVFGGGEPLYQYESLVKICKRLKELGFGIVVYTGYEKEEVETAFKELLKYVDFVKCGKFEVENVNEEGKLASFNQSFYQVINQELRFFSK